MKIARIALVLAGLIAFMCPVLAQTPGDYYMAGYFLAGTYLRAAVVCDRKDFVERSFSFISSNEFKAFSKAYPNTIKQWMTQGGKNFNDLVMKEGIPSACREVAKAK
jgi:hypothetical protein